MPQVRGRDLTGAVAAGMKFADPFGIDIEADDGSARAGEGDRHWQPHIAQPDDRDLASVRHPVLTRAAETPRA